MKQRTKAVLLLVVSAWSAMALTTSGARADVVRHGGSDVYWLDMPGYDQGETVPSASGLIRTEQAVAGWVDTEGLPPNTVVTLWWAIFNEPRACKHPTVVSRCDTTDLTTEDSLSSLHYATEATTDDAGTTRMAATLAAGSKQGCAAGHPCNGLLDPKNADVLLILRLHPGLAPKAPLGPRTNWDDGCSPNPCVNAQFAVHQSVPNWLVDKKAGPKERVVAITLNSFRYCASPVCTSADQAYRRETAGVVRAYNPQGVIDVSPGDTVTWFYQDGTWCDTESLIPYCPGHNIVFEDGKGAWPEVRSPPLRARSPEAQTFSWVVPSETPPGTVIPYFCDINNHFQVGMTGALRVID